MAHTTWYPLTIVMNDLRKAKLEMWKKKLGEANAFLSEALKRKSEAMKVGYLSENAYKMASEEIEMGHARINEINRIIKNLESGGGDKQSLPPSEIKQSLPPSEIKQSFSANKNSTNSGHSS